MALASVQDRPLVMGTVAGLLVIGGLGFGVVAQLIAWFRGRALRRGGPEMRLDLHSQVVLTVSGGLLLAGTAFIAWMEWNNSLSGQGIGLTMVQEILLAHGFDFALENREGGGAEFTIVF